MRLLGVILLYVLAAIALVGPILLWAYMVAMACAFVTNASGCGVDLSDFWDDEFLWIAVLPWAIGGAMILAARRLARETP